jgi:prepilin-type N-terminal cleavage/methylation domain-containing protein
LRKRLLRDESGFTLPEVLVTMMIMITVMFALYSIFDMSLRVFSFGNDKTEAVENARLGLERMEREIRAAYPYDKANGNTTLLTTWTANQITFGNDRNGDRVVDTAPGSPEVITYGLSGTTLQRNSEPVVEFVQALNFEYLNRYGATTTSEPDVAVVRVTLTVSVDRGPGGPAAQALTTDVALRNRV